MKTEDEILAQLRASQNIPASQASFANEPAPAPVNAPNTANTEATFPKVPPTPDLGELQKLMQPAEAKKVTPPPASETKLEQVKLANSQQ